MWWWLVRGVLPAPHICVIRRQTEGPDRSAEQPDASRPTVREARGVTLAPRHACMTAKGQDTYE